MALRQFEGDQYVPQFSDLSIITYDYELQDIDTVIIDHAFGFWQKRRSTIDYRIYPRDDYEWSILEFKEWRSSRDPCFIVDLSVPNPLDPCLSADILKDYALEFEVRVESTIRDLKECLTEAIRDWDCYRELLDAMVEDYDEMERDYEAKLATLRVELE